MILREKVCPFNWYNSFSIILFTRKVCIFSQSYTKNVIKLNFVFICFDYNNIMDEIMR